MTTRAPESLLSPSRLLALLVTSCLALACGGRPIQPISAERTQHVAGVTVSITADIDACTPDMNATVLEHLRRHLRDAGFLLAGETADANVKVLGKCGFMSASFTAEIDSGGRRLHRLRLPMLIHNEEAAAIHIVDVLVDSSELRAIAAGRGGDQRRVAVARESQPPNTASANTAPSSTTPPSAPTLRILAAAPQPHAFALIVGIERYRDVVSATGARHDAETITRLVSTTLGVPAKNVLVALDERATRGDLEKHLTWLKTNVRAGARVYFFFSGHGAPDVVSGTAFLLPYDGDPRDLKDTALPLARILEKLSSTPAREIVAVVDACFSGSGGRSVIPAGTRPLVPVKDATGTPRVALFAASSATEIAGPAREGAGGLFTHYVIEGLGSGTADLDGDGSVSLKELAAWVSPRVSRDAKRDHRSQTPSLIVGSSGEDPTQWVLAHGYATP